MKKRWKILIPVAVAAAAVGGAAAAGVGPFGAKNAFAGYTQASAELGDIETYRSFTGKIEPVTERNVLPDLTGIKIKAVDVEEGDEVKAGDKLVELDQDTISEQIKELEASMSATEKANALQIQTAQQQYNDYKSNIDSGNNTAIQSASQQVDAAFQGLVSAQQAYNNEVKLNNAGLSQTVLSAMQAVDSAYAQLQSAELQQSQAEGQLKAYGDLNAVNGQGVRRSQCRERVQPEPVLRGYGSSLGFPGADRLQQRAGQLQGREDERGEQPDVAV